MEKFSLESLKILLNEDDIFKKSQSAIPNNTIKNENNQSDYASKIIHTLIEYNWSIDEIIKFINSFCNEIKRSQTIDINSSQIANNKPETEEDKYFNQLYKFFNCLLNAIKFSINDVNHIKKSEIAIANLSKILLNKDKTQLTAELISNTKDALFKKDAQILIPSQNNLNNKKFIQNNIELSIINNKEIIKSINNAIELAPAFKIIVSNKSDNNKEIVDLLNEKESPINNNIDNTSNNSNDVDITKGFLIWPANPYLNINGITGENIKVAENLIKTGSVAPENIFIYVPKKGADGDFNFNCINMYLNSKLGLSSNLGLKNYKIITSIPTFVQCCKPENNIKEYKTIINKSKQLYEDDSVKVMSSNDSMHSAATNAVIKSVNKATIYCTPRIASYFNKDKKLFDEIGLSIEINSSIFKDDTIALSQGQQIFKDILSYENGTKAFSASKTDTKDTLTSINKQKESVLFNKLLKENNSNLWTWDNIKANLGAKQFIQYEFADVETIKKGLSDGGNPNKLVSVIKSIFTEYGKVLGAALGDAADLALESWGLGWLGPAIKAAGNAYRKAPEEYEGIEAFVRSNNSKSLFDAAEEPDFYIEKAKNR